MLSPVLSSLDVNVLDVTRRGPVVRVVLDRETGVVGIDDCTQVSRFLSHALDVEDIIPGRYRLEVSSPGLDRPLMHPDQFRRFTGRLCRVNVVVPIDGNHQLIGRIEEVDGERITLRMADGSALALDHKNVAKARLEIEF